MFLSFCRYSATAGLCLAGAVEAFAKLRELAKIVSQLPEVSDEHSQKSLMRKSGELLADILDDNTLEVTGDETTIEFNLAIMKIKHTTKRDRRRNDG